MIDMKRTEYRRSGKKLIKVVTTDVNEKRLKGKITRLKNDVAHANGPIQAWTRPRDALQAQVDSLEKAIDTHSFVFR